MTIEYASDQDTKALLTRGLILFKTSGGWMEPNLAAQHAGRISEIINNIYAANGVILMD